MSSVLRVSKELKASVIKAIMQDNGDKFVSVRFIKADGTVRDLVGRTGVVKNIKGNGSKRDDTLTLTIFDVQNDGYRTIRLDRVLSLKAKGVTHEFI